MPSLEKYYIMCYYINIGWKLYFKYGSMQNTNNKKILILIFVINFVTSPVFSYCYSLDPNTYNACIQRENNHNRMIQMQEQQLFMQQQQMLQQQIMLQKQLEQQKRINQQMQQQSYFPLQKQSNYNNYFTGNLNIDYFEYMRKFANAEVPYMSLEEFARSYRYKQ